MYLTRFLYLDEREHAGALVREDVNVVAPRSNVPVVGLGTLPTHKYCGVSGWEE